ncbi:hypothetical protein RTBOTA2_006290 [Rhodotorula toruloides]|nr:hypothetical protein RTBOTA2_006290 [Rhodotorula toruloides]
MAAAVLAPPAPLNPAPGALYDPDDLLALRVLDGAGVVPHGEDYTDDLEDLVSLSVAQHLRSKRSHQGLLSSRPSTILPPSDRPSTILSSSDYDSTSQNYPRPDSVKTAVQTLGSSTRQQDWPRPLAIDRGRQRSLVTLDSTREAPDEQSQTSPDRTRARRIGSGSPTEAERAEAGWETLQIGGTSPSASPPSARHQAVLTSAAAFSSGKAPTVSRNGRVRQRAVTHSPSSFLSSNQTPATTRSNPASQNRRSPASVTPSPPSRSQPRRTSLTTASSAVRAHRERPAAFPPAPSPHRSDVAALHASQTASPDVPQWANTPAPLIYRTSKGDLDYGDSPEGSRPLRPTDRVLPAVARRLEAERLRALAQGDEELARRLLVSEWGADGSPRRAVELQVMPKREKPQPECERADAIEAIVDSGPSLATPSSPSSTLSTPAPIQQTLPPPASTVRDSSVRRSDQPAPPLAKTDSEQPPATAHPASNKPVVGVQPSPPLVDPGYDAQGAGCCRCIVS